MSIQNLTEDEPYLESVELARERVRAIFENRGLQAPDSRVNRIAQEVIDGERGFVDVRRALQEFATRNADSGIPDAEGGGAVSEDIRQVILENFPSMSWAIDHPDLGPILAEAGEEGWTPLKLQGELQGTEWWQNHTARQRELQILKETDPQEYERRVQLATSRAMATAERLGVPMDVTQGRVVGLQLLTNELDDRQLSQAILGEVDLSDEQINRGGTTGDFGGAISQASRDVDKVLQDHLLTLPASERGSWIRRIISGEATVASMEQYAQKTALVQMPWLKDFIDQGLSPASGLAPYRQTFSRMLEMNPAAVDFSDPKYQSVLRVREGNSDRLATTSEVASGIRETFADQWEQTNGAKQAATELTGRIAQMFGRRD